MANIAPFRGMPGVRREIDRLFDRLLEPQTWFELPSLGEWAPSMDVSESKDAFTVKMEVPGMPPEIAKANIGQKNSFESCMTPEQAAKPPSDFFTNNNQTTNCTTESFAMAGGKLDATMICEDKNTPGKMRMTIKGDYQPTSYTATMTMVTDGAPNGGEMKITATTTGERIGECG